MVERLFLDRIDAEARRAAPGGQHQIVAAAGAHETQAALALLQLAFARTDIALQAAVGQPVPVAGAHAAGAIGLLGWGIGMPGRGSLRSEGRRGGREWWSECRYVWAPCP